MTRDTSARGGLGRNGVSVIVPPSWTSTFTWSPAFRCARSINAASNMTPCELPIFVIVLTMLLNYVLHRILSSQLAGEPVKAMPFRLFDQRTRLGHIGYMSAIAKSRIDPELKRQAEAVLEEIGLKPRAALELFYKQIIKRRAIPFPVQADSPEDEVLSSAARRNKLADEF